MILLHVQTGKVRMYANTNYQGSYPGIEVKKNKCVGHYQKRVANRLRRLKKTEKGLGGRGCLTDAVIDHLHDYFGVAIR